MEVSPDSCRQCHSPLSRSEIPECFENDVPYSELVGKIHIKDNTALTDHLDILRILLDQLKNQNADATEYHPSAYQVQPHFNHLLNLLMQRMRQSQR
jgi:hypothetical protein